MDKKLLRKSRQFKNKMVIAPILVFLEWKKEFHVHVDVSSFALDVVLAQLGEGSIEHPISFASRKLSTTDKNYTMAEREGLAMVYALQKFCHYLLGGHFKMYIDHSALKYLVNNPLLGGIFVDGFFSSRNLTLKSLLSPVD